VRSPDQPDDSLTELAAALLGFAQARDWERFHTPKNLAMALAGEAGELVACFQWLTPEESVQIMDDPAAGADIESELADVLQYLIRLADVLGVNLAEAVRKKMRVNEGRFPGQLRGAFPHSSSSHQMDHCRRCAALRCA
jgi:NTP pyrophosphatase (non-canonical NTP hydrolase)